MSIQEHIAGTLQRQLRIAVVTETFPPEINGVAHSVGRTCSKLTERGVSIQVVRPRQRDEDNPWIDDQILVRGISLPNYSQVQLGLPAGRLLLQNWRAIRPDIVHIVTEGPLGWSALHAARELGIPVTSSFHTNFQAYAKHYGAAWTARTVMAYLKYFHNRTRLTLVPTAQMRDHLAADGFANLAVVGRGVDTRLFHPSRRNASLRKRFGASHDSLVVLHVGRLAAEKNLCVVFEAFSAIRRRRPDAVLVIVGDGPERARLERENPGHHFAGLLSGAALAEHYASADMFLYPSLTETFGNVTLEAMASGLAVVAFDYAAAREHLLHLESGVLAPYGDTRRFIEMAAFLARSQKTIARLREKALQRAQMLGWDRISDIFLTQIFAATHLNSTQEQSDSSSESALAA